MSALHSLEQLLAGHRRLLVAYSGGLDSSVLLHQLVMLRQRNPVLQIRAIHVHHGLSSRADEWVSHCQQQCVNWQVPLVVVRVLVDSSKKGTEAAARDARYRAFRHHLQMGECLLTAQHLDDQCETFLLALKRGSGPTGLASMPAQMFSGEHPHLRPFLAQTRRQLECWAAEHHLTWVEDESNQDTCYDRNFLRQNVLPVITSRWPHFSQSVARSASLCGEQEQLLDELLSGTLDTLIDAEGALAFRPLIAMSEVRRAALLRRWIARQQGLMPSREALQRLWQEVALSREDADPRLQLGAFSVRRYRDRLYWLPALPDVRDVILDWPCPWKPLTLPGELGELQVNEKGMAMRAPDRNETVTVRFHTQGQFHIVGRAGSRPIKKLWQELGVPSWRRERTPLIFYGDRLIAATGIFVTREGDPADQPGWKISWQKTIKAER